MRSKIAGLLMVVAACSAGPVAAQHQDHQMPGQPTASGAQLNDRLASACVQSQQRAIAIAEQVSRRVEAARAGTSPADMRIAIDDLQAALSHMRTTLRSCSPDESGQPGDAHAGHNVGTLPQAAAQASPPVVRPGTTAAPPKPMTPVDHAAMGHTAPAPQAVPLDPQLVSACVQSQQEAVVLAERLNRGLEVARQTNSAAEMRAGMDGLPANLGELRASLQRCEPLRAALAAAQAAAVAATMDHSKMQMGGAPATVAGAKPPPSVAMDHSKMPIGAAPARGTETKPPVMDHSKMPMAGAAPAGRRGAGAGVKPPASTAPIDHSKMPIATTPPATGDAHAAMKMDTPKLPVIPAQRIPDPACPNNVTQVNAPKAVYQRKVYYFCTSADRDQFRKDPAAYLKAHPR